MWPLTKKKKYIYIYIYIYGGVADANRIESKHLKTLGV